MLLFIKIDLFYLSASFNLYEFIFFQHRKHQTIMLVKDLLGKWKMVAQSPSGEIYISIETHNCKQKNVHKFSYNYV